ncbi:MAG: S41 family peptidase [Planctomycetota bacterium]
MANRCTWTCRFAAVFTTAALLGCPAIAPAQPALPAPNAPTALANQATELARAGEFSQLQNLLEGVQPSPAVSDLTRDLNRYQDRFAEREDARHQAFEEALDEARTAIEEDKVEDALVSLIKAHSLADNPEALLQREEIAALINKAVAMATEAEDEHAWVDALGLFRLLDLLYEDRQTYKDDFRRIAEHVRILQLYNPLLLKELYKERAERLGEDGDEEEVFEQVDEEEVEDWTVRLAGVSRSMMEQTFAHAALRHIDKDGYTVLTKGSLEGLALLLETEGLDEIFEGKADDEQLAVFKNGVVEELAELNRPGRRLTRGSSMAILQDMIELNQDTIRLPDSVVIYEMTTGATSELDDFSTVIWPEDYRQFIRSIQGNFVGVGVQIQKLDGKLSVVTPLEGTPGMQAGLKAGDVIARVNGKPTGTWTIDKAVREITGPEGTEVELTVVREGVEDPLVFTITRRKIELESIKGWSHRDTGGWDYWVDKEAGIGYVRMNQFLRQTTEDLDAAIAQMQREGDINGLILDLRFNPGGLLTTAISVVDRFIDEGRIVSTVNGDGVQTSSQRASARRTYDGDFPVIVLINQGSASASEIVSGALQDYDRALIMGVNTYGKGSVQDIFPLGQGDALFKCTTQYYQLPQGRIIHRTEDAVEWGIQPDLEIKMTNDEVADWLEARRDADVLIAEEDRDPGNPQITAQDIMDQGLDPQLDAAILVLKAQNLAAGEGLAQRGE